MEQETAAHVCNIISVHWQDLKGLLLQHGIFLLNLLTTEWQKNYYYYGVRTYRVVLALQLQGSFDFVHWTAAL